jgi:nucleoside-diphosphate-sugar epimerase
MKNDGEPDMHDNRFVITERVGSIGSHLTKTVAQDNDVNILDDITAEKIKNRKEQLDNNKIKFIKESILLSCFHSKNGQKERLYFLYNSYHKRSRGFHFMKIIVVGGSGLLGQQLVNLFKQKKFDAAKLSY